MWWSVIVCLLCRVESVRIFRGSGHFTEGKKNCVKRWRRWHSVINVSFRDGRSTHVGGMCCEL